MTNASPCRNRGKGLEKSKSEWTATGASKSITLGLEEKKLVSRRGWNQ